MQRSRDARSKRARGAGLIAIAAPALLLLAGSIEDNFWPELGPKSAAAAAADLPAPKLPASVTAILTAIEALESKHDVLSYSRALRIENKVLGMPLSEAARELNVELQRAFAKRIWTAAARSADSRAPRVDGPLGSLDKLLDWQQRPDGSVRIPVSGAEPILIPASRFEQYASLANSLRALLAAQQDFITSGSTLPEFAPSDQELSQLRQTLDAATLGALMLAERQSREGEKRRIQAVALRAAWDSQLPSSLDISLQSDSASKSKAQGVALLDAFFDRRVNAHSSYNGLALGEYPARHLFATNLRRFYARVPLPENQRITRKIVETQEAALGAFGLALLIDAGERARSAGRGLIRSADAIGTIGRLLPHRVDEFDNAYFFLKLDPADRVTLEGFGVDSFRDHGVHWRALKHAIHQLPADGALPDPFAVEILAEAISHYGVLLLRLAGEIALGDVGTVRLQPVDIKRGVARIVERVEQNHNIPPRIARRNRRREKSNKESSATETRFFSDVTKSAKFDFTHRSSRWLGEFRSGGVATPPTFSGGGIAAEDLDGDSDTDLLLVGGEGNALLINDGEGRFSDVAQEANIALKRPDGSYGEARQPIIADFDNDGHQDILITYANDDHQLYRNLGALRFENVSSRAGLGGQNTVAGPATTLDFDQDGLLDIYVCNYADYLSGNTPSPDRDSRNGLPNQLFRNLGGMRFEDVTEESGTADSGWCQAVSHVDFDRDGYQDLIVANDYGRNAFLRNRGDGQFENLAPELGVNGIFHSMSVSYSDFNDDDYPDIYIANLATMIKDGQFLLPDVNLPPDLDFRSLPGITVAESSSFYISQLTDGKLSSYEASAAIERGATTTGWAWGAKFFDFDHDGDDDLYLVNGSNDYDAFSGIYSHRLKDGQRQQVLLRHDQESNVFFLNQGGRLVNVSPRSGADFEGNSRSTSYLDFDGDGDLDIAINNFHGPATLLRNNLDKRAGNWLKLRLIGDPDQQSNRDAIGARVLLTAEGDLRVWRGIHGGSGYLSMNPKELHFGLGSAESAQLQITWPNGEQQRLGPLPANRTHTVRQGAQGE